MKFRLPADAMQAKFSLEFAVAAPLIFGRLGFVEMRDECVRRDDLQALMRKGEREEGPDDDPVYPVGARHDTGGVVLGDGTALESEPVHRYRGHGQNPLSQDELRAKFMNCATVTGAVPEDAAADLFECLWRLEEVGGVLEIPEISILSGY